jgi:hypothetical protein
MKVQGCQFLDDGATSARLDDAFQVGAGDRLVRVDPYVATGADGIPSLHSAALPRFGSAFSTAERTRQRAGGSLNPTARARRIWVQEA